MGCLQISATLLPELSNKEMDFLFDSPLRKQINMQPRDISFQNESL